MDNQVLDDIEQEGLRLTDLAKANNLEASKWASFLAILGIIGLALFSFSLVSTIFLGGGRGGPSGPGIFVFLILMLLMGIPIMLLYQFATRTKKAMLSNSTNEFTQAESSHKNLFIFYGILALVYIVIILFAFVFLASALAF